jgi:hypothetical protein
MAEICVPGCCTRTQALQTSQLTRRLRLRTALGMVWHLRLYGPAISYPCVATTLCMGWGCLSFLPSLDW